MYSLEFFCNGVSTSTDHSHKSVLILAAKKQIKSSKLDCSARVEDTDGETVWEGAGNKDDGLTEY